MISGATIDLLDPPDALALDILAELRRVGRVDLRSVSDGHWLRLHLRPTDTRPDGLVAAVRIPAGRSAPSLDDYRRLAADFASFLLGGR